MHSNNDIDDPRRQWLIKALSTGLFGTAMMQAEAADLFGTRPAKLPAGQSVYGVSGEVTVNSQPVTLASAIKPGDTLQTGKNSQLIFVVASHAMILRGDSRMVIDPPAEKSLSSLVIGGLRMLSGKLLSVSRNSPMRITTPTATVGIRGTGFYIEADPEQSYFCTCYGATEVQATDDPDSKESIVASHHDRPVYIVKDGGRGKNIRNAPFLNHTDQELALIETLVGRQTPFVFSKDAYSAPRRAY